MSAVTRWCAAVCLLALALCACSPFNIPGHVLTVEVEGNGVGFVTSTPAFINCPGTCSLVVPPHEEMTLNASASVAGTTFVGWSGPCSGLEPCRVTLASDQKVIAAFALRNSLVVTRSGGGNGTVRSEPAGIDCGEDCSELFAPATEVTLTAAPAAGSTFDGWSGACEGKDACVVSAAQAQLVTATFAPLMLPLTVEVVGTGSGTIFSAPNGLTCSTGQCTAQFREGTQVTLRPSSTGSLFTGWTGACSGTLPVCTVTMTGGTAVTARFDQANLLLTLSPPMVTLARGEHFTFVVSGGAAPYTFSVQGGGVIDQAGRYTAPPFDTTAEVVNVRDSHGSVARATVNVNSNSPLAIAPATVTLARSQSYTFVVSGGALPYAFSIADGGLGSIDPSRGRYTAPNFNTRTVVRVTDGRGVQADAIVTVSGGP